MLVAIKQIQASVSDFLVRKEKVCFWNMAVRWHVWKLKLHMQRVSSVKGSVRVTHRPNIYVQGEQRKGEHHEESARSSVS